MINTIIRGFEKIIISKEIENILGFKFVNERPFKIKNM